MTITVTVEEIKAAQASSSQGRKTEQIVLPLPPSLTNLAAGQDTRFEMEIYARFMRHLRNVPNSRMEIKILSAIRFTADMLDIGEELVAKTLVDLGLRAPRKALPGTFLDFCDKCMLRRSWDAPDDEVHSDRSGLPPAVRMLKEHWEVTGEDRFAVLPVHYAIYNTGALV